MDDPCLITECQECASDDLKQLQQGVRGMDVTGVECNDCGWFTGWGGYEIGKQQEEV